MIRLARILQFSGLSGGVRNRVLPQLTHQGLRQLPSGGIMRPFKLLAVLIAVATLTACASDPYSPAPKQDSGAMTGALLGGLFGAAVGGRSAGDRLAGAVVGAVAGGLVGSAIGASMDEEDRRIAYDAEMQALESGAPGVAVGWRSERSRHYGNVVPGPYHDRGGRRCRGYTHTIYINGRPESGRGTACRDADGRWVAVS
jgi:surface antigen